MEQKQNKSAQFKQWISSIVIGPFRYRYEYTSPFGESWDIYRLWFGIIPIVYENVEYDGVENQKKVRDRVTELNTKQVTEQVVKESLITKKQR
jgi:hypothetical protein